jgi:hypothetical protein
VAEPTEIQGQAHAGATRTCNGGIDNREALARILEDRNSKAIALAISLTSQLQPKDRSNPTDSTDPVAWSLARRTHRNKKAPASQGN